MSSRTHYQFNPGLAKEQLQEVAAEKNKIALPAVGGEGPLKLPNERFVFSGVGFGLRDEWESEGEEDVDGGGGLMVERDLVMGDDGGRGINGDEEKEEADEDEDERMEDLFGETFGGGDDRADGEMEE